MKTTCILTDKNRNVFLLCSDLLCYLFKCRMLKMSFRGKIMSLDLALFFGCTNVNSRVIIIPGWHFCFALWMPCAIYMYAMIKLCNSSTRSMQRKRSILCRPFLSNGKKSHLLYPADRSKFRCRFSTLFRRFFRRQIKTVESTSNLKFRRRNFDDVEKALKNVRICQLGRVCDTQFWIRNRSIMTKCKFFYEDTTCTPPGPKRVPHGRPVKQTNKQTNNMEAPRPITFITGTIIRTIRADLPHCVKTQYLHFKFHASYFLVPWKIPEEICRRSMLFHN